MKWTLRNQRAEKWLNSGDFQVVGSLICTLAYIYSFFYLKNKEFYKVRKYKKKFESTTRDLIQL